MPEIVVTIAPSELSMFTGGSQQFTAAVTGADNPAVTWSLQEPNAGSINSSGLYVAPVIAGTFHVVATSAADATRTATAAVHVSLKPKEKEKEKDKDKEFKEHKELKEIKEKDKEFKDKDLKDKEKDKDKELKEKEKEKEKEAKEKELKEKEKEKDKEKEQKDKEKEKDKDKDVPEGLHQQDTMGMPDASSLANEAPPEALNGDAAGHAFIRSDERPAIGPAPDGSAL